MSTREYLIFAPQKYLLFSMMPARDAVSSKSGTAPAMTEAMMGTGTVNSFTAEVRLGSL